MEHTKDPKRIPIYKSFIFTPLLLQFFRRANIIFTNFKALQIATCMQPMTNKRNTLEGKNTWKFNYFFYLLTNFLSVIIKSSKISCRLFL